MLFTLAIFTGRSLKTFAPLKKFFFHVFFTDCFSSNNLSTIACWPEFYINIGVLRKFTISGDRESRDGGTFCWDNI